MKLEERDYSYLEGKELIFEIIGEPNKIGIVTGCDYNIGITIQEKKTNDYLLCLTGPKAPNYITDDQSGKLHKTRFFRLVRAIKKGIITERDDDQDKIAMRKILGLKYAKPILIKEPTVESCPFSQ